MVVVAGRQCKLCREGSHCTALAGGGTRREAYACAIYEDRPRTCRYFGRSSSNCLDARKSAAFLMLANKIQP
jgi:Fe-S-cluster containining protein